MSKYVRVFMDGSAIRLGPATAAVMRVVRKHLSYTRRKHLATWEEQQKHGGQKILLQDVQCFHVFDYGGTPQVLTNAGYLPRLQRLFGEEGFKVYIEDKRPEDAETYHAKWSALEDVEFRYKQRETITRMAELRRGRVWWATGSGKGWILPHYCRLMHRCRIAVTTKHLSVLETNYNRLQSFLPSVGMYHSKCKRQNRRVMCYSAGTLNHCATVFKPHILIADEVHELATDRMFEMFNKFRHARMFCLSANDGDRFDGADFELEGIFGPVISSLTYPEALKHGMVVPIHVHWLHVEGEDPVGRSEGTAAWRWGIWRNEVRNQIIADCARNHPEDQVLITCQTLEHACFLKGLLPEFQLCYAPSESHDKKLDMYKGWKLLSADERRITQGKLNFMRQRFEEGKLKKVIATTVWNRGVSFDSLQVLIRADGSSDAINDTQIPGRLARTMEGKKHGIMYDFMDHFCKRYKRRSDDRRRDYAKKKWKQHIPERETDEPVLSRLRNSR